MIYEWFNQLLYVYYGTPPLDYKLIEQYKKYISCAIIRHITIMNILYFGSDIYIFNLDAISLISNQYTHVIYVTT